MSETTSNIEQNPVVETLQRAADGLYVPSETDAPLAAFLWPDESTDVPLTPERFRELANVPVDVPVKSVSLATFFRPMTTEEAWHNEEEKAEVQRARALVETLKATLKRPLVFRVGDTEITAYAVGAVEGGWAGVQARVVET